MIQILRHRSGCVKREKTKKKEEKQKQKQKQKQKKNGTDRPAAV
jgi:hypothetical protein